MQKSVLAKLFATYLIIAFLLIGVLGVMLIRSCRAELLNLRVKELEERARTVGLMLDTAGESNANRELFLSMVKGIADEFDALLQITSSDGTLILEIDSERLVPNDDSTSVSPEITQYVAEGKTYIKKSYLNIRANTVMTTVAVPIFRNFNGELIYIIILNADDAVVESAFMQMLARLWVPCVAIVVIGLVLIIVSNYQLTFPLIQMNSAAREMAKGNFDKRIYVKTRDEVGQLAESFNAMAEQLSGTDSLRKDFVANISHELRSPLTSINGFVQGILDGTIPQEEHRKYLTIVLAETQRLSKLTRDMLELSRVESGKFPLNITGFDINELIRKVIITKEQRLEEKQIDLHIEFFEDKTVVQADEAYIEQVLLNLLDNAIKFTPVGNRVLIKTYIESPKSGKVCVCVEDTGVGIKSEDLPYVWERFYTENKSRTGNGGTGIGLAIVKKIILQHKQDIWADSKPGQGASFTFTLDLAPKNRKADRSEAERTLIPD